MAVQVIFLAGVPCSGKSSIFRKIRERLFEKSEAFRYGKAMGIKSINQPYIMLGVFDGSTFEGTDKLSMTVINDAIKFVQELQAQEKACVVFVEGDRLFNIRFLSTTTATLFLIDADECVLRKRHILRRDKQSSTFLRSRRSKVENFVKRYKISRIMNNTLDDQDKIVSQIIKIAKYHVHNNRL